MVAAGVQTVGDNIPSSQYVGHAPTDIMHFIATYILMVLAA